MTSVDEVLIRDAKPEDLETLYEMGIAEEGFAVSSQSRFYTKDYLRDWIRSPGDDVLLVAEIREQIVGFLFCRVNRNDWAMLENIAVDSSVRRLGIGTALLTECLRKLRTRGISYIAGIVREGNNSLDFFVHNGFSIGNRFIWIEKHLEESEE